MGVKNMEGQGAREGKGRHEHDIVSKTPLPPTTDEPTRMKRKHNASQPTHPVIRQEERSLTSIITERFYHLMDIPASCPGAASLE